MCNELSNTSASTCTLCLMVQSSSAVLKKKQHAHTLCIFAYCIEGCLLQPSPVNFDSCELSIKLHLLVDFSVFFNAAVMIDQ